MKIRQGWRITWIRSDRKATPETARCKTLINLWLIILIRQTKIRRKELMNNRKWTKLSRALHLRLLFSRRNLHRRKKTSKLIWPMLRSILPANTEEAQWHLAISEAESKPARPSSTTISLDKAEKDPSLTASKNPKNNRHHNQLCLAKKNKWA